MLFLLLTFIINFLIPSELFTPNTQQSLGGYAARGQFPFMVALYRQGQVFCGGSIISEKYILTAAHCVHNHSPLDVIADIGAVTSFVAYRREYKLTKFIIHPKFDAKRLDYDIALMEVKTPITLGTATVDKIQLSDVNEDSPSNTTGIIIGYSVNIGGINYPNKLKYALIPMWSRQKCNCIIYPPLPKFLICAGNATSCEGDSGGPLIIDNTLVGVVSFGYGCGKPYPVVYTRVSYFRSWIIKNSKLEQKCNNKLYSMTKLYPKN